MATNALTTTPAFAAAVAVVEAHAKRTTRFGGYATDLATTPADPVEIAAARRSLKAG